MHNATSDTPSTTPDDLIPLYELTRIRSSRRGKNLHIATLYRWAATGRLPTVKIGGSRYVRAPDLEKLLAGQGSVATKSLATSSREAALRAGRQLDQLLSRRRAS